MISVRIDVKAVGNRRHPLAAVLGPFGNACHGEIVVFFNLEVVCKDVLPLIIICECIGHFGSHLAAFKSLVRL